MSAVWTCGAFEEPLGGARPWQAWYETHRPALRRYLARSLGPERDLAEDFLQDVYVRALAAPSAVPKDEEDPRPWLFRIATNLLIDHYRRSARRPAPAPSDPEGAADRSESPETETIRQDLRRRLRDAVARLPEAQREVFLLREYGDVPFREIALRTGAPLGTVLARMRYAMIRLKTEIDEPRARGAGEGRAARTSGPGAPRGSANDPSHDLLPRPTRTDS